MSQSHFSSWSSSTRKAIRQAAAAAAAAAVVPAVAELLESRKMLAAGVSGAVYVDADNDGKLDTGETGIANVTITLTGTTTAGAKVTKTAKTNSSGRFLFDGLAAGVYKVVETQPSGYLDGKDATGFTKAVIGNDVISN